MAYTLKNYKYKDSSANATTHWPPTWTEERPRTSYSSQFSFGHFPSYTFILMYVFCVFTVTSSKIKMQTSEYRKSRIGKRMKINIQKASPSLCDDSYARYSEKRFIQIYKVL